MLMNETYLGTDYYPKLIEKEVFDQARAEMKKRGAHLIGRAGRKDKEAVAVQTEFLLSSPSFPDCGDTDPSSLFALLQPKNPPEKKKPQVSHKGWYKGAAPYGFEREKGELIQIEDEAALIREIFETVGSGISLIRVANDLNEREIPTKRIHNPVYVGRIVTEEEFRKAEEAVTKNCKGGGRKKKNHRDALGYMPGAVFMQTQN